MLVVLVTMIYLMCRRNVVAAKVDPDQCTACGLCEEACPAEAITVDETAVVDDEKCTDCGTCVDECPSDAITMPE